MGITIIKPVIINISIHALVKRATKAVILYLTNITFQSTPS